MKTINNNELQTFFYQEKNVRTVIVDGEPWWVLKDICDVLKISNSRNVSNRLKEDEKNVHQIDTLGGIQKLTIINQSGLFNVILRSDKTEADKFRRWITHEVLSSIYKHGAYITTSKMEEIMNDPDAWITLLTTLKKERLAKEELQNQNEQLQTQINNDKPKIVFADAVSVSQGAISVADLAKILKGNGVEIGQKRLFQRLREDGFLIRREGSDRNSPTQRAMQLGLFRIKETAITRSDGRITISKTAKITGRGQCYFIDYFLNKMEFSHADQ